MIVSLDSVTNSHQDLIMRIRQRGNITLFSCLFLLMMSSWSLVYLKRQARSLSSLKKKIIAYRCVKELNGSSKAHVKKLESLNNKLVYAHAAVLVPNPALSKAASLAIKGIKLAMEFKHAAFLKQIYQLTQNGCLFNPSTYKTPYKNKGVLTRDELGRAKLRSKKWKSTLINLNIIIRSHFNYSSGKVGIETESWEPPEDLL